MDGRVSFGKLDVRNHENLQERTKRKKDVTVRDDGKLSSRPVADVLEKEIRREGDATLRWLAKEEATTTKGRNVNDWKESLRKTLSAGEHGEGSLQADEHIDKPTPPVSPRRKGGNISPLSYQSFVEAEPRNFLRGKKKQGRGTEISVETAEPRTRETSPGKAYIEMTPTFCEASLGTNKEVKLGLLDSCAQLSLMGKETLDRLILAGENITRQERKLKIRGIGSSEAHEFCALKVSIMVTKSHGSRTLLETEAEFWIVESLHESFVLGMDFITKYGIDLFISKRMATLKHQVNTRDETEVKFPLFFGREWKTEMLKDSYEVTARNRITIPPRSEGTVNVVITSQDRDLPPHDLWIEPVVMCNLALNTFACTAKGIYSSNTQTIWFGNMGDQPVVIERGMKLGKATHMEGAVTMLMTGVCHETGVRGAETKVGSKHIRPRGVKASPAELSEVDIFNAAIQE